MSDHLSPDAARPRVLFVCTHNAGRSALAAALAAHHAVDRIDVDSAGTDPDPAPSPATIATLAELSIDAAAHRPSAVTADRIAAADVVVAMKPGLDLPQVDGVRYETWALPDPAGWDAEGLRPLRDEIDRRVRTLISDLTFRRDGAGSPEGRQ
ncbi:low molecular weight phosphatase family protein [Geodermatophilus sp. SYSU D00691]